MLTAPRRITLYGLLLLLPTLFVGGAAIGLLRREQTRIAAQSAETFEARKAAVAARARLTVETIELTVGDVQAGLLDTLALEPAEGLDEFLARWEQNNPLVRIGFRSAANGSVLRPEPRTTDEEARGFLRRFPQQFGRPPPWVADVPISAAPISKVADAEIKRQAAENEARREISQNVANSQSFRRDVQELLKTPAYSNQLQTVEAPASLADVAGRSRDPTAAKAEADQSAVASSARRSASASPVGAGRPAAAPPARTNLVAEEKLVRSKLSAMERRGWTSATINGRLHVAGWGQMSDGGEVRGVELELAALISRLGLALPQDPARGEGYALQDDQGRVVHQAGTIPAGSAPTTRIPVAATVLPGWEVAGYLGQPDYGASTGGGFFWASALLVVIFVGAILAGGALLAWQARRSEAEAAQKTSFVANVSHEFKTPLTTIRLYSELLEQGRVRDAAQGGEYLRTIGRETQRLARLVNNVLDFSRLEQGRKKFAREQVELTAEVARLLATHAPRLTECGMTLRRELPAQAITLSTDRDALEQIVLNLLDNACKYALEGGEVTVALAARPGGGAELRVGDRGPGVPAGQHERIFEKFHRVDDKLTAEKSGAGLGLSIARQLARGLGGELRYAPRAGGGAEFILELP